MKEIKPEDYTVICAWCNGVIQEGTGEVKDVSHGMCEKCQKEHMEETKIWIKGLENARRN